MPSSTSRVVSLLAAASFVLLGLGGCFLLPLGPGADRTPSTSGEDAAAGPKAGDCWEATHRHLADWSSWKGDGPVPCDEHHQAYTYLAADLEAEVDEAYDDNGVTNELLAAASDQCDAAFASQFDLDVKTSRLGIYFFVPDEDAWDDGDRSVRCDVALLDIGSDYVDPDLADLPRKIDRLIAEAKHDGLAYGVCLVGDGYGPFESAETVLADCNGDYYWRLGGYLEYPGDDATPYPSGDRLTDYGMDECPSLGIERGETVLPYAPTEQYWNLGARSIQCWFSLLEAPSSSI